MQSLEIQNLKYIYPDGHEALKNISFTIRHGEKIGLIGANGSGKSTLLLNIAGAFPVQSGKIFLDGNEINNTSQLRNLTGLIFQDPDDQILMPSVIEDTAFNLVAAGMNVNYAQEKSLKILQQLGILHLKDRPPHKLSGGEKRMTSLAGILISEPEILALDEPTSALDPGARRRVINFLNQTNKTILLASHDLDMILDTCSRAIILNHGNISADDSLPDLFKNKILLEKNGLELPLRYA